jgi:hypothetical protein
MAPLWRRRPSAKLHPSRSGGLVRLQGAKARRRPQAFRTAVSVKLGSQSANLALPYYPDGHVPLSIVSNLRYCPNLHHPTSSVLCSARLHLTLLHPSVWAPLQSTTRSPHLRFACPPQPHPPSRAFPYLPSRPGRKPALLLSTG